MPKVKGQKSSKVMLSKKEAKAVRGLIEGETKQVASAAFEDALITYPVECLTCAGGGLASEANGIIDSGQDSVHIKFVELKGYYNLAPLAVTAAGLPATIPVTIRRLVVWFYKPVAEPDAAGTLPPITEVLVTNDVKSMVVDDSANAGRFKVLSDKTIVLGSNVYVAATSTMKETKVGRLYFEEKIIVGKTQKYVSEAAVASNNRSGHYDSDVDAGRVSRGLLCMYHVYSGDAGTPTSSMQYRVTYVG